MECANVTTIRQNTFTLTNDLDSLVKQSIERYRLKVMNPQMTPETISVEEAYRAYSPPAPFLSSLVCSVTQERCSVEDFFIFQREDKKLDVIYGVSNLETAQHIAEKFPYYPAASGDSNRKIIGYYNLIDMIGKLSKDGQETIRQLTDGMQVGQLLFEELIEPGFIKHNLLDVIAKIQAILTTNLGEFQTFDSSITLDSLAPKNLENHPNCAVFQLSTVQFVYADKKLFDGVMCPQSFEQLMKCLKIDIASFPIFFGPIKGYVAAVDETHIKLRNNEKLLLSSYIRDNQTEITVDLKKLEQDVRRLGTHQDESSSQPIYRGLSLGTCPTESVTFKGFDD